MIFDIQPVRMGLGATMTPLLAEDMVYFVMQIMDGCFCFIGEYELRHTFHYDGKCKCSGLDGNRQ